MTHPPPDSLTLKLFSTLHGTRFRVRLGAERHLDLELAEAVAGRDGPRTDGRDRYPRQETFSLLFTGPVEPLLPQQIYRFEHDQVGAFDLFIVPIGRDAHCVKYQAIFNRMVQSG